MLNLLSKIKHKWAFFLLGLIALLPVIYAVFIWQQINTPIHIVLYILALALSIFALPFIIFKMQTAFYITWIWVLFAPLELASFYIYKTPFREGLMLLILQTDFRETMELLSAYKTITIIYITLLIIYPVLIFRFIENINLFKSNFRKILLGMIASLFLLLYGYSFKLNYDSKNSFKRIIKDTNVIFEMKFIKIYPINIFKGAIEGINLYNRILEGDKVAQKFSFNAKQNKTTEQREIYVFVIGETARADHFSINGYQRQTTPLLQKTTNLFSFSNVLSEANLTSTSLPILLTRATAHNYDLANKEKGIIDLFNEVDFNSYWIANQSLRNPFVHRIFKNANQKILTAKDFESSDNFDEKLLIYLDKILRKKEQRQFIVIHSLGSHFRYNQRYPKNFEKYKPALTGLTDLNLIGEGLKNEMINSYDNTIYYTDYFLANAIKRLEKENAVSCLFYISDHGEGLFENGAMFHGSPNPFFGEVHVPMLVWFSEKYIKFNQEKIDAVKNNLHKKMTSEVVFFSLADIANISFLGFSDRYISNLDLQSDSVRYVRTSNSEVKKIIE